LGYHIFFALQSEALQKVLLGMVSIVLGQPMHTDL